MYGKFPYGLTTYVAFGLTAVPGVPLFAPQPSPPEPVPVEPLRLVRRARRIR